METDYKIYFVMKYPLIMIRLNNKKFLNNKLFRIFNNLVKNI